MRFLSLLLCSLIAGNPIWARANAVDAAEALSDVPLHVRLVDEPGLAQPQSTSVKGYVLQVTTADGSPVGGAAVALRLPEDGPTGRFTNGLRAWVAYSDTAGIARFPVIQWGETAGSVELKITAAKGSNHAALMVAQRIGVDPASVSVVSVPFQKHASAVPTEIINQPTQATPVESVGDLGVARRQVLSFNIPVETETADVAIAPKPAQPQAPQVAVAALPGTVFQPLADTPPATPSLTALTLPEATPPAAINISHSGVSPDISKPHSLTPNPPAPTKDASSEPTVTITNTTTGAGSSESHKKMWILLAVGAGAGAAALLGIMAAHGGGAAAGGGGSNSGVTVGTPTISVGH
jgi:hypothetical protein